MANGFHLSASVVGRGAGHSAVAASAYIARTLIENERTGDVHNYSRGRNDVLWQQISVPKSAPDWMGDRARLWNSIEKTEKHPRAQLCRNIICALPHELTTEQQTYILKDFLREQFARKGYVADAAMHRPDRRGDERNIHAHILVTMRTVNEDGSWSNKDRTFSDKGEPPRDLLKELRVAWAARCNRELVKHGFEPRFDHRSYEEQGLAQTPTTHVGKNATNMARDGKESERAEQAEAIRSANRMQREAERIEREEADKLIQAQSAIDRMRAEDRAEQLEALRAVGRNRWTTMGDQLRDMFNTLRRLTTTMGDTISAIVKGGDFFIAKAIFSHERTMRDRQERAENTGNAVGPLPPKTEKLEATKKESPTQTLERMAAEKRAKRERERVKQEALNALRDAQGIPRPSRKPKLDI